MSCTCGCCTGVVVTTPALEANRPGLGEIGHRPGAYASYLATMTARLSASDHPELAALRKRDPADPSIALCDAWAITAEVLSFYQDRIANEGYLRTATERNSLLQLGRLTGYEMRPGVAASAYLAYTIDASAAPVTIPAGTRVQSVPAAGEKMQTFETAESLNARAEWSRIKVRATQPQWRDPQISTGTPTAYRNQYDVLTAGLYLDGTSTRLKPNDALLVDYDSTDPDSKQRIPYRVDTVTPDPANKRTRVRLRAWSTDVATPSSAIAAGVAGIAMSTANVGDAAAARSPMQNLVASLEKTALISQPRSAIDVPRTIAATLAPGGEARSKMLLTHKPALSDTLAASLRTVNVVQAAPTPIKVHALRSAAALFGNSAPQQIFFGVTTTGSVSTPSYKPLNLWRAWKDLFAMQSNIGGSPRIEMALNQNFDAFSRIPLESVNDRIQADGGIGAMRSFVMVDLAMPGVVAPQVYRVRDVGTAAMAIGAAIAAKTTVLSVDPGWLSTFLPAMGDARSAILERMQDVSLLRLAQVYVQSEELALAADPLQDDVEAAAAAAKEIELDGYHAGLSPGMWVIVGGRRADFSDANVAVGAAERAMIASVRHGLTSLARSDASGKQSAANLPGDTLHTFVTLAAPLTYTYKRETFTIYGNVVRATHGQTTRETLGAGDATRVWQKFALKAPPLTYVSAPTPNGTASTLQLRVDKLLWRETHYLADAANNARVYCTRRDDSEATSVVFGDGKHGARLPTGQENVAAVYRSGIGAAGNVRAEQLTVLADKPLGATAVSNPIRASGGADADTLAQARVNAPLSVTALDRLVSIRDYADFACTFAGIGKAAATKLPGPGGDFVEVTIAGIDDAPIEASSDLYRNLVEALHDFGDPHLPIRVDVRAALAIVIQAGVALQDDYDWSDVQPRVVAALHGAFGFQARDLGQPVFASEIIAAIQSVRGVAHVVAGAVRLLDDDELIDGLAPSAPAPADALAASTATQAGGVQRWFSLTPVPNRNDEGSGAAGWLDVPAAYTYTDANGKLAVAPAQVAYLPANVPEALILELAS